MFGKLHFISFLFCLILSCASKLSAQTSFEQFENIVVFSTDNEIINGQQWVYQKKYEGHPFWKEDKWYNGYIIYHGIKFENISLRYDIHSQNIVVLKKLENEMRAYILNKDFLESFALFDDVTGDSIVFMYNRNPDGLNNNIYYNAFNGFISYKIIYRKSINNRITNNYTGEYILTPTLLAENESEETEFRTGSEFLKLFGDKKADIKKFMRQHRIKFKKQFPEQLIPVFSYYDTIINSAPDKL